MVKHHLCELYEIMPPMPREILSILLSFFVTFCNFSGQYDILLAKSEIATKMMNINFGELVNHRVR